MDANLRCSILFFLASAMYAQQDTGMITGQILDASGSAIPLATVLLVNTGTNVQTSVATNSDGLFVATPLRIGVYSITVGAKGFKKAVRDNIALRVQDRLRIDFRLEVGEVSESVEVTSEAPLLQSETSSLGQVIAVKP